MSGSSDGRTGHIRKACRHVLTRRGHCRSDRSGAEQTLATIREKGGDGEILAFDVRDRQALEGGSGWKRTSTIVAMLGS